MLKSNLGEKKAWKNGEAFKIKGGGHQVPHWGGDTGEKKMSKVQTLRKPLCHKKRHDHEEQGEVWPA